MQNRIKALLLAAGYGTRLRPITDQIPKCLIEIGGITMLERWLKSLEEVACNEAVINTHYLAREVDIFLEKTRTYPFKIHKIHEPDLQGTAGTLIANRNLLSGSTVIMAHVDNVTDMDLGWLMKQHRSRPDHCVLTMATFETDTPESCGIVECDKNGVVLQFHEKSKENHGNKANGAVYIFEDTLIDKISSLGSVVTDFSQDVLPNLIGKIYTAHWSGPFIDMGTPENLERARQIWPSPIQLT